MATRAPKTTTPKKVTPPRQRANKTNKSNLSNSLTPTLDPRVFSYPVNEALLSQVIHVYRANTHQNTSQVKTRGEVNRTTKKVYKQKGTGNARHGARSAPIYVGGGVAHGPSGVRPISLKLNRKMRAAGLAGVLTLYAAAKRVELLTPPQVSHPKTKSVKTFFNNPKSLLIYHTETPAFLQSVRNISDLALVESNSLNPYTVSLYQNLVLTKSAHDALIKRLTPLLKPKSK